MAMLQQQNVTGELEDADGLSTNKLWMGDVRISSLQYRYVGCIMNMSYFFLFS